MPRLTFLLLFFLLGACSEPAHLGGQQAGRILAMGDSLLAWNAGNDRAISDIVERSIGEPVVDRSVVGARVLYALPLSGSLGLSIPAQYVNGDWDWVILNGGGNDLWLGCACSESCARKVDKMISRDGLNGAVPQMVQDIRASGARVIYLGYLRTPGRNSPIDHCREVGDQFEDRLAEMARRDSGVFFLSNRDLVPYGDLSFHAADRIHPSTKGSAEIGARVARLIQGNGS